MTPYEYGFLTKCAELGVADSYAVEMLKFAQLPNYVPNKDGFQNADKNGVITLDGSVQQVVRKGDTISGILARHGIPQKRLADILKANGLTLATAKDIRPGNIVSLGDPTAYAAKPTARPTAKPAQKKVAPVK